LVTAQCRTENCKFLITSTGAGSSPINMAISNNSQYLYWLNAGNQITGVFRIDNKHGKLKSIETLSRVLVVGVGLATN